VLLTGGLPPYLAPGIYEYITLCGRKDFADVIKGVDLEMGRLP